MGGGSCVEKGVTSQQHCGDFYFILYSILEEEGLGVGKELLTISFNPPIPPFKNHAQFWPFGKVVQIKPNVVCFSKVIQVAGVEFQQVCWRHWSY